MKKFVSCSHIIQHVYKSRLAQHNSAAQNTALNGMVKFKQEILITVLTKTRMYCQINLMYLMNNNNLMHK